MPPTEHLWAPWRMDYILADKPSGCIFCKVPDVDQSPGTKEGLKERLILHIGVHAFVIMNLYPYNSGHLMVVPRKHTADLDALDDVESKAFFALIKSSATILKTVLSPDGLNIGMNLGKSAGAGIDEHLHMHLVPRWDGDTNFMPVFTGARVTPENLHATFDRLEPNFLKLS